MTQLDKDILSDPSPKETGAQSGESASESDAERRQRQSDSSAIAKGEISSRAGVARFDAKLAVAICLAAWAMIVGVGWVLIS